MTNVLGVWLHVAPGTEVLCDVNAHVARAEMGAHGALTGVTMRTWPSRGRPARRGRGRADRLARRRPVPRLDGLRRGGEHAQLRRRHRPAARPARGRRATSAATSASPSTSTVPGCPTPPVATGVSARDVRAPLRHREPVPVQGARRPGRLRPRGTRAQIARARVQRKRLGGGWRQAGHPRRRGPLRARAPRRPAGRRPRGRAGAGRGRRRPRAAGDRPGGRGDEHRRPRHRRRPGDGGRRRGGRARASGSARSAPAPCGRSRTSTRRSRRPATAGEVLGDVLARVEQAA